jgi:uncharacterized protein YcfJ
MGMNGRFLLMAAVVAASPFVTGCQHASNTAKGAGVGGALGAGTGALIGSASGNAGKGAVIGGLIGAVTGGAIGNEHDQREKAEMESRVRQAEERAEAAATQLGIADVIQLAKEGRSDDVIINQMRTTGSTYQLSTEDIRMLSSNGVSDTVIKEMQCRRPGVYPRRRFVPVHGPVLVAPPPPVYLMPVCPPPPAFGVGVHIRG